LCPPSFPPSFPREEHNHSTWEAEGGRSLRSRTARSTERDAVQPELHRETPSKKKKKKKGKERKRKEKNNSCCPNIHRIVFFHWSMVNISGTTLFKEKNSLPFSQ
jgi:hypothetical protein